MPYVHIATVIVCSRYIGSTLVPFLGKNEWHFNFRAKDKGLVCVPPSITTYDRFFCFRSQPPARILLSISFFYLVLMPLRGITATIQFYSLQSETGRPLFFRSLRCRRPPHNFNQETSDDALFIREPKTGKGTCSQIRRSERATSRHAMRGTNDITFYLRNLYSLIFGWEMRI